MPRIWSRGYRSREIHLIFWWLVILIFGFMMSCLKVGDDENWLARAGGLMTILSVYLTVPAELERQRLRGAGEAARRLMDVTLPQIERQYGAETAAKVRQEADKEIKDILGRAHAGVRRMEVFLLVTGTLIWAFGDLIKYLRPWLVRHGFPQ